jgi:hypothetical protein
MNSKAWILSATAFLLFAAAVTVRAAAGDPPTSSLDPGAVQPKSDTLSTVNPGGILPVGQSQSSKQKASTDTSATGTPSKTGVGTAIKSPLGTKGVLGGPVTSGTSAPPAPRRPSTANCGRPCGHKRG